MIALSVNSQFHLDFIRGKCNVVSDAISRDFPLQGIAPYLSKSQTSVIIPSFRQFK